MSNKIKVTSKHLEVAGVPIAGRIGATDVTVTAAIGTPHLPVITASTASEIVTAFNNFEHVSCHSTIPPRTTLADLSKADAFTHLVLLAIALWPCSWANVTSYRTKARGKVTTNSSLYREVTE